MFDDFTSNQPTSILVWTELASGGGSGAFINSSEITASNQGIIEIRTGNTPNGRGGIRQANAFVNPGASGACFIEWLIKIPTVSVLGQLFFINIGWTDSTTASEGINSIAFRYASGNWIAFSRSGGIETAAINTGVAIVAGQWTKLRIEVTSTGADFMIATSPGGVLAIVASIPAVQLPNSTQRFGPIAMIQKLSGATSRLMYIDYSEFSFTLTVPR